MAEEENKEKEKKLQEKFVEFQMLQQQAAQVQKQLQQLEAQKSEVENIKHSLTELKEVQVGSEMLVSVASGIFAKAKLAEKDELLVNVGGNVVVKKKVHEVNELLSKQGSEIKKVEEQLTAHMQKLAEQAGRVEKELNGMITEAKKNV